MKKPQVNPHTLDFEVALEALCEKHVREQECEYCKNSKSLHYKEGAPIQEVYIKQDGTMSVASGCEATRCIDFGGVNFKINFCPMCGRRLSVESEAVSNG